MTLRFILDDIYNNPFEPVKPGERAVEKGAGEQLRQLYIEPTSRCNLNCAMCMRRERKDQSYGDMDVSLFDKIIGDLPESARRVFFCGIGEPLCHPDILHMIREVKSRGLIAELITNGTLLDARLIDGIFDACLDTLWISLDSLDEKGYENIRSGADYSDVMKNIQAFNAKRGWQFQGRAELKDMRVKLGVMFVMRKDNIAQLHALFRNARTMGLSYIKVTHLLPYSESQLSQICYERMLVGMMMAEESDFTFVDMPRVDIRDVTQNPTQSYYYWPALEFSHMGAQAPNRRNYCKFVREGIAYVRQDGVVSPCMSLLYDNTIYQQRHKRSITHCGYGNAGDTPISEIWDSAEYARFRGRVERFDFSPCSRCGGCERFESNEEDCYGNTFPTCGPCLWAQGLIQCP